MIEVLHVSPTGMPIGNMLANQDPDTIEVPSRKSTGEIVIARANDSAVLLPIECNEDSPLIIKEAEICRGNITGLYSCRYIQHDDKKPIIG